MTTKPNRKFITIAFPILIGICILVPVFSALANRTVPDHSTSIEVLSAADKVRLEETLHLLDELGDAVWSGWDQADKPMIVYNEEYAFLVGYPHPPEGWVKIPSGNELGTEWERVANDTFQGETYYRQRLTGVTPEAFTVMVGERWVCSLPAFEWMQIELIQKIRNDLPSFLQPAFPYRLFVRQLVSGDDQYISLNVHECFHALQGGLAAEKLAAAEDANIQQESQYSWENEILQSEWKIELELLAEALRVTDQDQSLKLVHRFLEVRAARRSSAGLTPELIAYEQKREWVEGLARYAELEIWRLAATNNYLAIPETEALPLFDDYLLFEWRWRNELAQFPRMADDEGDGRFYYSGMAQAYLLDRYLPDWKASVLNEDVWLDNLLQMVVQGSK